VWDDDEKHRIVAQTQVPGVSVSQVAPHCELAALHARQGEMNAAVGLLENFVAETADPGARNSARAYLASLRPHLH